RVRRDILRVVRLTSGTPEPEGLQVVMGEDVSQVVRPLSCLALDPGGCRAVPGGPCGAGELVVADVPDQQVPEAVFLLSVHRARAGGAHELLAGELVQRLLDLAGLALTHLG